MDVSPTDMIVGKAPVPPEGYEISRIDVVVRLRRKGSSKYKSHIAPKPLRRPT
jgi:Fur family transcriptional regulator, iron response regulator